jgi:hypothetical protein
MDHQRLVKIAVKATLGLGVSALIGATIKQETKIQDVIDNYFQSKTN